MNKQDALAKLSGLTDKMLRWNGGTNDPMWDELVNEVTRLSVWVNSLPDDQLKVVKTLAKTASGCPCVWKGQTTDGDVLWIHYRYGTLEVKINGQLIHSVDHSDPLAGVMDTSEMIPLVPMLDWSQVHYA